MEVQPLEVIKKEKKEKDTPPSLDYFNLTGVSEKGQEIFTCVFCNTSLTRKITRFNEHLLLRCKKITEEAKDDLMERLPGKTLLQTLIINFDFAQMESIQGLTIVVGDGDVEGAMLKATRTIMLRPRTMTRAQLVLTTKQFNY